MQPIYLITGLHPLMIILETQAHHARHIIAVVSSEVTELVKHLSHYRNSPSLA